MLTNSTNNLMNASGNLALTMSARAAMAVVLCSASLQVQAAQYGRQFGSNDNQQHNNGRTVSAPAAKPAPAPPNFRTLAQAPANHPMPGIATGSMQSNVGRPTPTNVGRPTPSQPSGPSPTPSPMPKTPTNFGSNGLSSSQANSNGGGSYGRGSNGDGSNSSGLYSGGSNGGGSNSRSSNGGGSYSGGSNTSGLYSGGSNGGGSYSRGSNGGGSYNGGSNSSGLYGGGSNNSNPPTPSNFSGNQNSGWSRMGGRPTNITNVTNTTTYVNRVSGNGFGRREHEEPRERVRPRFIPENHFRANFGHEHEFHVSREAMFGGHRRIQFGGVYFGITRPWPMGWMPTDALYIDYVGGSYMLCNRMRPGIRVPVTIDECPSCQAAVAPPCESCMPTPLVSNSSATCSDCATSPAGDAIATLSRGQTIAEVVSILGTPNSAIDLGAKQIYIYQNMKVVFIDGRMNDVI